MRMPLTRPRAIRPLPSRHRTCRPADGEAGLNPGLTRSYVPCNARNPLDQPDPPLHRNKRWSPPIAAAINEMVEAAPVADAKPKGLRTRARTTMRTGQAGHLQNKLSVLLKLKGECGGGNVWPNVARAWTENTGSQRTGIIEHGSAATVFACGAGDGNLTRTVSLGRVLIPPRFRLLQWFWRPHLASVDPYRPGRVARVWPGSLASCAENRAPAQAAWPKITAT